MSELRAAADKVRLDSEPGERWTATIAGLSLVVGLTVIDALWEKNFPSTVVIGRSSPRWWRPSARPPAWRSPRSPPCC